MHILHYHQGQAGPGPDGSCPLPPCLPACTLSDDSRGGRVAQSVERNAHTKLMEERAAVFGRGEGDSEKSAKEPAGRRTRPGRRGGSPSVSLLPPLLLLLMHVKRASPPTRSRLRRRRRRPHSHTHIEAPSAGRRGSGESHSGKKSMQEGK